VLDDRLAVAAPAPLGEIGDDIGGLDRLDGLDGQEFRITGTRADPDKTAARS
jgi:hypothetical protein